MLYITQLIYIKPGKEELFLEFENKVIPLMGRYTGKIIQRIRPTEESFVSGEEKRPYEIHIVSFDSDEDFMAYARNPERNQFMYLKDQSVEEILMFKGSSI
ncbi:MAG: DUF1330 domain-containing protein [Cyclobacteriaceae bacterium]